MRRYFTPLLAALVLAAGNAMAQAPAPAPAAAPAPAPAVDPAAAAAAANLAVNEMIGDWTLRCFRIEAIAPCDILQVASQQETQRRVLLVSIAYVPSSNLYGMQVIVPLSVALSKGMTIAVTGDTSLTALKFSRCERDGCYVEIQLAEAAVGALRMMEGSTTINIGAYGSEQNATLPLSLNGFGQAVDRLRTEARSRAVTPRAQ